MIPKMRLWLVRHGQTDWNANGRCLGRTDLHLNNVGKDAVERISKFIDIQACDAIYCSPSSRTFETAKILVKDCSIPIEKAMELREIDFGHWEGKTWEEIHKCSNEWNRWKQEPVYSAPYGGESLDDVARRVSLFYKKLLNEHEGQTVLIVGHGGCLNMLLCNIFQVPLNILWTFRLNPASFSEVVIHQEGLMLTILNQTPTLKSRVYPPSRYGNCEKTETILQVI